jgi:hypothetical protein
MEGKRSRERNGKNSIILAGKATDFGGKNCIILAGKAV